jgi:hypothetical protein
MRIRQLAVCTLLLACSCRFIIDADQFRGDNDADPGGDAVMTDTMTGDAPGFQCGQWQSGFIDFDLLDNAPAPPLFSPGAYYLDPTVPAFKTESIGGADIALEMRQQSNGEPVLVLRAEEVHIPWNVTLQAQHWSGMPPLIIAARAQISIEGTLDVSSIRWISSGAGAIDAADCGLSAGASGSNGSNTGSGGGGGGLGWNGASGGALVPNGPTGGEGGSALIGALPSIRGGCPGGSGASGSGVTASLGGNGGGAVHLVTCEHIDISGVIHASGGGGQYGTLGTTGGGAGGGSGGYIGLEASTIRIGNLAVLAANGGGGGGGGQNNEDALPGADGDANAVPALGGSSLASGGNGGAGSTAPVQGSPGGDTYGGGGGGGAGQGVILLFSDEPAVIENGATVSPAAGLELPN